MPVLAPSLGQLVLMASHQWHSVFVVLLLFGVAVLGWTALRLPETLDEGKRKSIAVQLVSSAVCALDGDNL